MKKETKKLTGVLLTAAIICSMLMGECIQKSEVSAAAKQYRWKLLKQIIYTAEESNSPDTGKYTRNVDKTTGVTATYHEASSGHDDNYNVDFNDDITFTMTCSKAPASFWEGDEITFDISTSMTGTCTAHYWSASCYVIWDKSEMGYGGLNKGYSRFDNIKNKKGSGYTSVPLASTTGLRGEEHGATTYGDSITVYHVMPTGGTAGAEKSIYFCASGTKVEWRYRCEKVDGSSSSQTSALIKPAKVNLKSVKGKKGKLLVIWKKLSKNCTGYQIQVCKKKYFKKKYLTVDTKFSSKTKKVFITGLSKGVKRYIRVRAYNTDGKSTVYGKWSVMKSAKAK